MTRFDADQVAKCSRCGLLGEHPTPSGWAVGSGLVQCSDFRGDPPDLAMWDEWADTLHPVEAASFRSSLAYAREHGDEFNYHTHYDNRGFIHRCYHRCRGALFSWQFWFGLTVSFPFEHLLWERIWPFKLVTQLLGL